MRFLLDANIPYSACEVFDAQDDVRHVRDLGLATADDEAIFARAQRDRAVLVTRDLEFGNILLFPPARHAGIVVLKIPSSYHAADIKRVLRDFLSRVDRNELLHVTVIVEEGRHRIRR